MNILGRIVKILGRVMNICICKQFNILIFIFKFTYHVLLCTKTSNLKIFFKFARFKRKQIPNIKKYFVL